MEKYFENKVTPLVTEFVERAKPIFEEAKKSREKAQKEFLNVAEQTENLKKVQKDCRIKLEARLDEIKVLEDDLKTQREALDKATAEQKTKNLEVDALIKKTKENEAVIEASKTVAEDNLAKKKLLKDEYAKKLVGLKADIDDVNKRKESVSDRERKVKLREQGCERIESKNKDRKQELDERQLDLDIKSKNVKLADKRARAK